MDRSAPLAGPTVVHDSPAAPGATALLGRALFVAACLVIESLRLAWESGRGWFRRPAGSEPRPSEALPRLLERLGPTYVKLGQILSSRPDLLPPRFVAPLRRLQDRVAPFAGALVPGLLRSALGERIDRLAELETEPVASASVAQVHRARLNDGRTVALKIRRPGVRRTVQADLRLLTLAASLLERLPPFRRLPLTSLVEEVGTCIVRQLDFRIEARNLRRFNANFRHAPRVTLCAPVEDLSTDSVLTLDFLTRLEKVDSRAIDPACGRRAALAGLRALYKMIFLDGFVHADLHPGNVFVRDEGEIVIVDGGLVAELDPYDRLQFVDFFLGIVTGDGAACARILLECSMGRPDDLDAEGFRVAVGELVGRYTALRAADFNVSAFAFELFDTQRRFRIRGSTKFTMTILSLVVFEGIVKQLHPDLDFQVEARPYLIAAKYGTVRADYCAVSPPSTTNSVPVMKDASSEARNTIASATSTG